MAKSRWFRVAVEGATTDGRKIERSWLSDMAANYNRTTYAARVNMEHIRGITADPPFQALGDVLAVKTEEVTLTIGGKDEKKLALFAEVEALEPLVAMNARGQKLYTSIEVNPNFADTGKAYLMGLAVTDSPASLGTEMLTFCAAQGDKSPLAARKQQPGNLFTETLETDLVIDATPPADEETKGLMSALTSLVQKLTGAAPAKPVETPVTPPAGTADAAQLSDLAPVLTKFGETIAKLGKDAAERETALRAEISALSTKIDTTASPGTARPPATGGNGGTQYALTDC